MKNNRKKYRNDFTDEEWSKLGYLTQNAVMRRTIIKWSVIGVLILFLIITFFSSLTTVPTGFVGVKTRFGQVQNTVIQEGLNIKMPYVEKIVKIDCRTQKLENSSEASTKDMQIVNMTIVVNYNVNKETANTLYREVGTDYESIIINPAILESIKSIAAQYTAEELITKRAEVSSMIQEALYTKIGDKGFVISDFNITNIDFSDSFNKAIEAKAVKQQEVQTAQAELEKQKIQNEQKINTAEAEAKVRELQSQSVTEKSLEQQKLEIQKEMIQKWNGQFPTTMLSDDPTVLFNINK